MVNNAPNRHQSTSWNEEKELMEDARMRLYDQFSRKLYKAVALKDQVLSDKSTTGLLDKSAMPNHSKLTQIAERLNRLQCRLAGIAASSTAKSSSEDIPSFVPSNQDLDELDKCIIELTEIAPTVTIADMPDMPPVPKSPSKGFKWFRYALWALTLVGIIAAIAGFVTAANGTLPIFAGDSLLAASLGLLGGVAFSFFNVLGIAPSTDFDITDWSKNIARLLLGVLLGWVFYFAFVQSAFANFANAKSGAAIAGVVILLPFLAGYSTVLVVAILDKTMDAVLFALGLNEKSTSVSRTDKSKANTDQSRSL